jgi:PncC family amidohydrolase
MGEAMKDLLPHAEKVAALLKARNETIAVSESSSGGLIAAALLAVPGASAYFAGGAIPYNRNALMKLMNVGEERLRGPTPGSGANALLRAQVVRGHLSATWGISESGVAGPTGSRYGHAPGHTAIAISGPVERTQIIETGESGRLANMYAFATAALTLLARTLEEGASAEAAGAGK